MRRRTLALVVLVTGLAWPASGPGQVVRDGTQEGLGHRTYGEENWLCTEPQIDRIDRCHRKSLAQLIAVKAWMESGPGREFITLGLTVPGPGRIKMNFFERFFGKYVQNPRKYDDVLRTIDRVITGLQGRTKYKCYVEGQSPTNTMCNDTVLHVKAVNAWSPMGQPGFITLCNGWLKKSWSVGWGIRPMCSIVLHELFHRYAAAEDHFYFFHWRAIKEIGCDGRYQFPDCKGTGNADSLALYVRDVYKFVLNQNFDAQPAVEDHAVLFQSQLTDAQWSERIEALLDQASKVAEEENNGLLRLQIAYLREPMGDDDTPRFMTTGRADDHAPMVTAWMTVMRILNERGGIR